MYITMNEQYRREKEQFALKECCEHCLHFCAERKECEVMYPVEPHLRSTFDQAKDGERIYFCKMFEVDNA